MLEQKLIEHCSPTLASLKTGSLFNMNRVSQERLRAELEQLNHTLGPKGISLAVLSASPQCTLIYVYRKSRLERDLNNPAAASFLNALGYECSDAGGAIERLRERLALQRGFPHEIGVFLGYPVEDVKGFIKHNGRNSKCVGCWKVYCNQCEAERAFARFNKCREVYMRLWRQGKSVQQLTVAA